MKSRSGFFIIYGVRIYYEISGYGNDIVFLHGNPLNLHVWDNQAEFFARHYTVLCFDFRGFGKSGNPGPGGYSHAEDLKALLNFLGIKQTIVLGHSMGGGMSVNFAIQCPEMTRAVVLIDSSLGGFKYSQEFTDSLSVLSNISRENGVRAACEVMMKLPIFKYVLKNDKNSKKIIKMLNGYSGWHWLNKDTGIPMIPPAIKRLEEIKCPAIVIAGEHDTKDFHNVADILAENIPRAEKVIIKGIGHIPNMEAPEEFNNIVQEFLKNFL